jgi:hypothetical protein
VFPCAPDVTGLISLNVIELPSIEMSVILSLGLAYGLVTTTTTNRPVDAGPISASLNVVDVEEFAVVTNESR